MTWCSMLGPHPMLDATTQWSDHLSYWGKVLNIASKIEPWYHGRQLNRWPLQYHETEKLKCVNKSYRWQSSTQSFLGWFLISWNATAWEAIDVFSYTSSMSVFHWNFNEATFFHDQLCSLSIPCRKLRRVSLQTRTPFAILFTKVFRLWL